MTRPWWGGLVLVVAALVAGCSGPGSEPSASGTVWTPTPGEVVSASATVGPVSSWSPDEQVAVDAVSAYLAVWSRIGQDLAAADWNEIRDVAVDPAAQDDLLMWNEWGENRWHLVGEQTFSAQSVTFDKQDEVGSWYFVDGCTSIVGSDLVDENGQSVSGSGRRDVTVDRYSVVSTVDRRAFVVDSEESPEGVELQC